MADVTGARGTLNILQGQREIDMADGILELEPDSAPLMVLSKRLQKKATINPEFRWLSDELDPRYDAINNATGYTNAATSIVVDNGAYFAEHDIVQVTRTGENMRVTAVATNTLTVIRGVGSTAAAINDNDELVIIGSAQPEGDTSKPARSTNPTQSTNYTQIFRTPWEMTETLRASNMEHTPHDWNHQAKKKGIEHEKSIELSIWHGRSAQDTSGSQPRRTTGGVFQYLTQNLTDAGGVLTEAEFWGAFRTGFRYGSKNKALFGSFLGVSVINQFGQDKLQTVNGEQAYGLNITRYTSPFGTVNVVAHPLLEGSKYGGYLVGLDMNQVAYRFLAGNGENRDTKIRVNIQQPDADTSKSEYLTEAGLQFGLPRAHFAITGITG